MTRAALSDRTDAGLVGIDVGGTKCLGVLVDATGAVLAECRQPTPHARDLVAVLASIVDELGAQPGNDSTTVGVGVPGLITFDGIVRASPNLRGARDIPVASGLSARLGVKVHVENDATSAAHGEWRAGAARGADDAVMVTLGTGIGGGIVMGGQLQRGAHGFAGEMGHMIVERDGIACPCGLRGCWERYASGSAPMRHTGARENRSSRQRAGERRVQLRASTHLPSGSHWGLRVLSISVIPRWSCSAAVSSDPTMS